MTFHTPAHRSTAMHPDVAAARALKTAMKEEAAKLREAQHNVYKAMLPILKSEGLGVIHLTNQYAKGGMTIVYEVIKGSNHVFRHSTSLCNPKDAYEKRAGIVGALTNWQKGHWVQARREPGLNTVETLLRMYQDNSQ